MKKLFVFAMLSASVSMLAAQSQPGTPSSAAAASTPVANAVSHTTKAMHYRPGANTKLPFQTTDLMTGAIGEAKIEAKKTSINIEAKIQGVDEATKFGLEYLTYVLWAVSPEGRADNLGELVIKKGTAELKTSTDMQTFGLIVTAEPYFAVTQPGNMVIMEGAVPEGEVIGAKFELVGKGTYSSTNEHISERDFRNRPQHPDGAFRSAKRSPHRAHCCRRQVRDFDSGESRPAAERRLNRPIATSRAKRRSILPPAKPRRPPKKRASWR